MPIPATIEPPSPALSVVIPTRDRLRALRACLASLSHCRLDETLARGVEVLVVDDGGSMPLQSALVAGAGLDVRVLRANGSGPAAARNLGARQARGRSLAFIDDDCRAAPDWLVHMAAALSAEPHALVGGRVLNDRPDSLAARAHQSLLDSLSEWYDERQRPLFYSNNLGADRQIFLELGGFDESFPMAAGEDFDLCDRWRQVATLRRCQEATVYHQHPASVSAFLRVHRRYGRGSDQFRQRAAQRRSPAAGREALGLYTSIVSAPLCRHGWRGAAESALLAASQVANAIGRLEAKIFDRHTSLPAETPTEAPVNGES